MNRKSLWLWLAAALVVWLVATPSESDEPQRSATDPAIEQPAPPRAEPSGDGTGDRDRDRHRGDGDREPTRPEHRPRTHLVVHVVDGDTLDLANGERVRLVGIDTPEVGECGFEQAAVALADLVLDRQVVLHESDEDRDRYGRLLRYVDVGGTDSGLQLIRRGLAIARYDSRDGYGFHPREPQYVAADRGTQPVCPTRPVGFAGSGGGSQRGSGCAPGYQPCVPPAPPDLDCADVDGPIRVTGSDPHRLDGDGDGTACE